MSPPSPDPSPAVPPAAAGAAPAPAAAAVSAPKPTAAPTPTPMTSRRSPEGRARAAALHPVSRSIDSLLHVFVTLACIGVGVVSLFFLVLSLVQRDWFVVMFEATAVAAAVMGVLAGRGRFDFAPGLGFSCVGGTILGAALLGEPKTIVWIFDFQGAAIALDASWLPVVGERLGSIALYPFAVGQILVGAALMFCAALVVWIRKPARSFRYVALSLATGVPALVIIATPALARRFTWLDNAISSARDTLPVFAEAIIVLFIALLLLPLISIAGHCSIRSLEVGATDDIGVPRPDAPTGAAPRRPAGSPAA